MISTEAINALAPDHNRTSCSDDARNGNEYFNESGHPRCSRCALLFLQENGTFPYGVEVEHLSIQFDTNSRKEPRESLPKTVSKPEYHRHMTDRPLKAGHLLVTSEEDHVVFSPERGVDNLSVGWHDVFVLPNSVPSGYRLVPAAPSESILKSMALRHDHSLGLDSESHRLQNTMRSMTQLYEEAVGLGFASNGLPNNGEPTKPSDADVMNEHINSVLADEQPDPDVMREALIKASLLLKLVF